MELLFIGLSLFSVYVTLRWIYRERPATKDELIEARFKNIEAKLNKISEKLEKYETSDKELMRWNRALSELKNNS